MIEVIIWILVAIFLVVIDIITSSFIFMWFSLGALVAIILSLLNFTVLYQIIAFNYRSCTISYWLPIGKEKIQDRCKASTNYGGNLYW